MNNTSGDRLLLVDGMALAYRSFYGVKQAMNTSAGMPTNALYGFIRTMDLMRKKYKPTHWQVVFDGGIPVERRKLLPDYKAQRKPMPDELRQQLDPICDYLDAAGISRVVIDQQEADDVLATLAQQAASSGRDVLIATSDKDLFQIVSEQIQIVLPKVETPLDRDGIMAKAGVYPEQIIGYLALLGDSADNIPGIPGVGKKTAANWLAEYKTIENVVANVDSLKPSRRGAVLKEHLEVLERNLKMVRLNTCLEECQVDWDVSRVVLNAPASLIHFYEQYEFHSLAKAAGAERYLF